MTSTTDDEARWSEAQSILDRTPTDSAARHLRRSQRNMWLLAAAAGATTMALIGVVVWSLADGQPLSPGDDVSTARAIAGFGLSGVGLVLAGVGVYRQFRAGRRARGYGSPLRVLTRRQRKELLSQVRGRAAVPPERLPLARHLAELMEVQWLAVVPQTGLLLNFVGQWIALPSTWRLIIVCLFAPVVLVAALVFGRNHRQMQRFLDQHPQDRPSSSAG